MSYEYDKDKLKDLQKMNLNTIPVKKASRNKNKWIYISILFTAIFGGFVINEYMKINNAIYEKYGRFIEQEQQEKERQERENALIAEEMSKKEGGSNLNPAQSEVISHEAQKVENLIEAQDLSEKAPK